MRRILLTLPVFLAATGAAALSLEREREYQLLAGRAVSVADACLSLGVPVEPEGMIDEIEEAMSSFGGTAAEIEEWRASIVAGKSPEIRDVLSREAWDARRYYCFHGLSSQRQKLRELLGPSGVGPAEASN